MVVILILAILASWRLTSLLAEEEGPLFRGQPFFVWFRFKVSGKILGMKGAGCVFCMSVYTGAFFASLIFPYQFYPWYEFPIWWLGISGGTILVHSSLQYLLRR